ncbi:carbohydrate ABC transporter substrate-binding protein, CUT1 family [Streptomyces zhaozhouensis]|uniref:Carbohydrate ABC transporter substrate-binding protein, CUT1 family n=1 Tax=Streptomyces zhaozhouensis TaxID=1300267 RepID=A0A286E0F9_9ACTN|nr:sugar ABC transporter substrate-binding protein [Streptomyces zhaozhouensis]SOD64386.1 carbohydrate ABC transporter substrate-binding protein, CUT1 family [Streptomyces zhaozhouensis]
MLQHDNVVARPGRPPGRAPGRGSSRRGFLAGAAGVATAAASPALLTGCGSGGGSGGKLTFWNQYAPQRTEDPAVQRQSQWFIDLVDQWNATHDRQIELVFIPNATYTDGAKLPSAFAAESGPDIFLISPGDFLRYYNGGVLTDLTPYMDREAIADYGDSLETRTVDGRVYALPMEVEPLAIYYSVSAFERAGLSEGDIPTTWDQLLDVGDRLRGDTRAGLAFDTEPGYYQNFTWYPWMWQGGGEVFAEDGSVTVNSRATRQALQLWQDAVQFGISPRTMPAAGDLLNAFQGDNVAMWQSGIWEVASFRAHAPDFEYGVFKLPVPDGGSYTTAMGGWAFCANAQGKDPEAAAEFCAWALGTMDERCINRMVEWCTVAKTDMAPRQTVLELGEASGGYDFWAMKKFRDEIFPGGRGEPRYPPVVYKALSDAIQGSMLAGRDVAGQAERAEAAIQAYVKSYEGASLI